MDDDVKQALKKEFATKADLEELSQKSVEKVVGIMDQPCEGKTKCAVHEKIDNIQKEAFLKGVGLGRKVSSK